jgi:hypothetical protein
MNKLGYQPLPVLLRAEPSDARWSSRSAKILRVVATLGTLFALGGVITICLIAFNAFPPGTPESKAPVKVPLLPSTNTSISAAANPDSSMGALLPDTDQGHRGTIAEDHSIIDQTPPPLLNPTSTSEPSPKPAASISDSEMLKEERPETGVKAPDRHLAEAVRRTLEKKRREAERNRSRLEEMYRQHAISGEAYKKGEEQYRSAIESYRMGMNARTEAKSEVAGQN